MEKISKIEEDWRLIFDKYNILSYIENDNFFKISAGQIKEYHEPRIMVKFDHKQKRPKIFSENNLSILPITRGDYIIGRFKAYHDFEVDESDIKVLTPPEYITSLNYNSITSETIALNCAFASGIINDFACDTDMFATVSGRMGSGEFSFIIDDIEDSKTHKISVANSQIEIDAAYEGHKSLLIIEAKRELADDFLVRQLYYPYRVWNSRIKKPVKSIFLVYSNGVFRLYEYSFTDLNEYGSLELVKQQNYAIEDIHISRGDLTSILANIKTVPEPEIPFPQADKFERVINLCELLVDNELSRSDVTDQFEFDARQSNYYSDAARYLGFLDKTTVDGKTHYILSDKGRKIMNLGYKEKQLQFCEAILSHDVFFQVFKSYLDTGKLMQKNEIIAIMINSKLYNMDKESTFERRSSTVRGWIQWIIQLIGE